MRSAARQPKEEPGPERADLDAKAVQVLDEHLAASAGIQALMSRCPDPQSAALLRHALVLIADAGTHAEELRAQMKAYGQANESLEVAFQAGRDYERKLQAAPPVLRQGHRAPGKWTQNPILRSIKVVAFALLGASGLKALGKAAGHTVTHPAAIRLTAHSAKMAAGAVMGAGVTAATAVIVLAPGATHAQAGAPGSGPNPAASIVAAAPAPASTLIAMTKPKPKHAGKGKTLLAAGGLLPVYSTAPQAASSSAPSSSQPSVQASVQVGPAQLTVSAASLDLSNPLDPQATFTITASGGGWASWRVATSGTDLDFSPSSGVLKAGAFATVTVSLAPSLDNLTSQAFTVAGQTITVALPLPIPLPSPTGILPSGVLPSGT